MYEKLRGLTADMVRPVSIHGLKGRMLTHPSRHLDATRTIIFVYGIHGSLERFYGVIHYLARFGKVVVPDLPGLGGMDPFYNIGKQPSLDAYGDYLAEFINKEVPRGELTLVGMSYGFVALTRMLVRHPELNSRVNLVISTMGLADGRDINLNSLIRVTAKVLFTLGQVSMFASLSRYVLTRPWVLKLTYSGNNPKMKALAPADRPKFIEFESYLWKCNDMRTYCRDMLELFDYRQPGASVPLIVHHISTASDHWLDVAAAEKHIGAIFQSIVVHTSHISNHGGTAYTDESEAQEMIPKSMAVLLEAAV